MSVILKKIGSTLRLTVILLLICGLIYPLVLTGVSQIFFPYQANGSVIEVNGVGVGLELVGQNFTDPRFMKGRPSAVNYNTYTKEEKENGTYSGVASGSDNYAATNPKLIKRVEADMASFLEANPSIKKENIPADLLTASGSGLDPHISSQSAAIQIPALVKATGLTEARLEEIVRENTTPKVFGIFGEEVVNVLKVNLEIAKDLNLYE